jgi:hypothetical protein
MITEVDLKVKSIDPGIRVWEVGECHQNLMFPRPREPLNVKWDNDSEHYLVHRTMSIVLIFGGIELRAYTLSHSTSPFFFWWVFLRCGLSNYLARLASNLNPPDLRLLVARIAGMSYLVPTLFFFCHYHWWWNQQPHSTIVRRALMKETVKFLAESLRHQA